MSLLCYLKRLVLALSFCPNVVSVVGSYQVVFIRHTACRTVEGNKKESRSKERKLQRPLDPWRLQNRQIAHRPVPDHICLFLHISSVEINREWAWGYVPSKDALKPREFVFIGFMLYSNLDSTLIFNSTLS